MPRLTLKTFPTTRAVLALLATCLLLLVVPRLADTVLMLAADNAGPVPPATARVEAAWLEGIDNWWHDPFARIRAATLRFQATASGGNPDPAEIQHAIDDFQSGLARAPADAKAWLLLALARYQDRDPEGARLALRSSILIAPYDPALLLPRAEIGLKLGTTLEADDRQLVSEQIRMAADHQFEGLVTLAQRSDSVTPILNALDGDPDRAAALTAALEKK